MATSLFRQVFKSVYTGFYTHPRVSRFVSRHFHRAWYQSEHTYLTTQWMGVQVLKCPFDTWMYQEILYHIQPDLLVETGTAYGGSALYLASMMDIIGRGEVMTIDIEHRANRPQHQRITYLTGSSTDPELIAQVQRRAAGKNTVMVVLDSDHSAPHVLAEMETYGRLVTEGSYLVVEDTHIGHPVPPFRAPGPMDAVRTFLASHTDFASDPYRERLLMSFNYHGYLKKLRANGSIDGRDPVCSL